MKEYLRIIKTTHAINLVSAQAQNLSSTIIATKPEYEEAAEGIRSGLQSTLAGVADDLDDVLFRLVGNLTNHETDHDSRLERNAEIACQEAGYRTPKPVTE